MSDAPTAAEAPAPAPVRYGMILDEPIDAYHANRAVSKSKLDAIIDSTPAYYFAKHVERSIPERSEEWAVLGNAAGALILEGQEAYAARYAVEDPQAPARPTDKMLADPKPKPEVAARIAYWAEHDKLHAGKQALTARQDYQCRQMQAAVLAHPLAHALLACGKPEVTVRVNGRRYDVQCRFDWLNLRAWGGASQELCDLLAEQGIRMEVGQPYAADLKSTRNLSDSTEKTFGDHFCEFGYHRQGPFYRNTIAEIEEEPLDHFFFIAVEKEEPFACQVFLPGQEENQIGWDEIRDGFGRLNECLTTQCWPGKTTDLQIARVGTWYKPAHQRKRRD
jgi:exodeoxyribonuclease VIII